MWEPFTERARKTIVAAQAEATSLGSNFIGTEHLVLGMLAEGEGIAATVLGSLGIVLEHAREEAAELLGVGRKIAADSSGMAFSPRAKECIEGCFKWARDLGCNYVGTAHLLLSVASVESAGSAILVGLGLDLEDLISRVLEEQKKRNSEESSHQYAKWESASEHLTPPAHGTENPKWQYHVTHTCRNIASFIENDDRFFTMIDKGWRIHSFIPNDTGSMVIWERAVKGRQNALTTDPKDTDKIEEALAFAARYGGIDGEHHKAWVVDQMVRALTSDGYEEFVVEVCDGEDGPETYSWDEGVAP